MQSDSNDDILLMCAGCEQHLIKSGDVDSSKTTNFVKHKDCGMPLPYCLDCVQSGLSNKDCVGCGERIATVQSIKKQKFFDYCQKFEAKMVAKGLNKQSCTYCKASSPSVATLVQHTAEDCCCNTSICLECAVRVDGPASCPACCRPFRGQVAIYAIPSGKIVTPSSTRRKRKMTVRFDPAEEVQVSPKSTTKRQRTAVVAAAAKVLARSQGAVSNAHAAEADSRRRRSLPIFATCAPQSMPEESEVLEEPEERVSTPKAAAAAAAATERRPIRLGFARRTVPLPKRADLTGDDGDAESVDKLAGQREGQASEHTSRVAKLTNAISAMKSALALMEDALKTE